MLCMIMTTLESACLLGHHRPWAKEEDWRTKDHKEQLFSEEWAWAKGCRCWLFYVRVWELRTADASAKTNLTVVLCVLILEQKNRWREDSSLFLRHFSWVVRSWKAKATLTVSAFVIALKCCSCVGGWRSRAVKWEAVLLMIHVSSVVDSSWPGCAALSVTRRIARRECPVLLTDLQCSSWSMKSHFRM